MYKCVHKSYFCCALLDMLGHIRQVDHQLYYDHVACYS